MENSDSETGVFDWSVGTIVWVRRRNGSWWPGKILGPDELSASHVMSPRSGTPVKLLGREDASVDWYNLEKSKRVKPFRCGEFDDCIEKAEASHGLPPKKREKYARREDAILHALELEKQLNEKKHGKGDLLSDFNGTKLPDAVGKEAATSPHRSRYGNGKHVKSGRTSKGLGSGTEEKKKGHRGKEGNHSMDDDSSGGQPRMRGLQDLGLRPATSKQKHSSLVMSNGLHKHALEDGFHGPIDGGGLTTENMTNADPKDVLDKRKRSQDVEEPLGKRRDKRRPLVQVLESSAKLQPTHSLHPQVDSKRITPIMLAEEVTGDMRQANKRENVDIPVKSEGNLDDKEIIPEPMKISAPKFEDHTHASPADGSEENTSGSTEDTETDTSGTDSLEVGADDVMTALSDEAAAIELIPKSLGRSESQQEHGIMNNEEHDDLGLPGDMSPNQLVAANVTMSKWQLKGKRNNRSSTKRYRSMSDRKFSKGVSHGMHPKEEGNYGGGYCYDDADPVDKNLTCMVGYGSRGLDSGRDITNWEDLSRDDQPALRGCWEDSAEYYEPVFVGRHFGGRVKSMLIDVDLKVQSSYQREHVPMISLMSKLNGKAIVGHPIPVETLENGSSDILLSPADDFQMDALDYDTALQPMRKTAKRSANSRVPRLPHLSSALDGEEHAEHPQSVDQDKKLFGKSNAGNMSHKGSMMRKGSLSKPSRKQQKKISLSSSQKIRTLSSLGTQVKQRNDPKPHSCNGYQVDGLIKPESLPTTVACIPVKLVFSRLHEELVARHQ